MILPVWFWLVLAPAPCGETAWCKCAQPGIEEDYARSEAVFRGVVQALGERTDDGFESIVTPLPPDSNGMPVVSVQVRRTGSGLPGQRVTFRVTGRWKGARADTLAVVNLDLCGVVFEPGREYLVYAERDPDGKLVTSFCHRSRAFVPDPRSIFAPAAEDLPVLDRLARGRRR